MRVLLPRCSPQSFGTTRNLQDRHAVALCGCRLLAASRRRYSGGTSSHDEAIARKASLLPIAEVAKKLKGVDASSLLPYGHHKAKIPLSALPSDNAADSGKLILVTAITPTKAGEGKTTTSIGLCDGLNRLGQKAIVALREPSLGPVFGMKGGAAGGGYAQVVPMDEINLHFTGDFHAIGAAHNLLSAMVDNHIYWQKEPLIDARRVAWRRVVDMNDRALRHVVVGLGGAANGFCREDGYDITVASEVMAIFCLAKDMEDLQERLGNIIVGYTPGSAKSRRAVFAKDLRAQGAMAALLKEALAPNLVQTLEHSPALVHGGPFANIAHGCNSVIATKAGLQMADFCITEAGFGADLGAEKFFNIKCRKAGLMPAAAVVVATVRALKLHGGSEPGYLNVADVNAVIAGMQNLLRHIENLRKFGMPVVVCINRFPADTEAELQAVMKGVAEFASGVPCVVSEHWANGGQEAEALAQAVLYAVDHERPQAVHRPGSLYADEETLQAKIEKVATEIYRADAVHFTDTAKAQLAELQDCQRAKHFPVCMAKTQYSFSDDPKKLNAPAGHTLTVRELRSCNGAEFVVALTGSVMTMPGLPKQPAAEHITVKDGYVRGLF
eukprot:TRINITY_DN19728_c0_g1_i3.p1 TRINITY_DN19728_c0_g1~~TRINITY_DN19728_c0_g1_i3.p1  ORF type:complete len:612 (-),score=170.70 TRINITY_DN19728_c0_g1_i3:499-2334(-)